MTQDDPKRTAAAAPEPPPRRTAKGESTRLELGERAQASARRIAESKAVIPHIYLTSRLELAPRAAAPGDAQVVAALGAALRSLPQLNASYRDGAIERHSRVNVGIAVEAEAGRLVPTVFDADSKTMAEIERELASLREGAAIGSLTSPQLAGGTATLTFTPGPHCLLPAIIPGQLVHLAISQPRPAAVVAGGELAGGRALELAAACDGRAVSVGDGSRLLERIAGHIGAAAGKPGNE